jgi:hypothetical protein
MEREGYFFGWIMVMFKKQYNCKIIAFFVTIVFFSTNTVYGVDLSYERHLRKPLSANIGGDEARLRNGGSSMASQGPVHVEELVYKERLDPIIQLEGDYGRLFYKGTELDRIGDRGNNDVFDYGSTVIRVNFRSDIAVEGDVELNIRMGEIGFCPKVISHGRTENGYPYLEVDKIIGVTLEEMGVPLNPLQIRRILETLKWLINQKVFIGDLFFSHNWMFGHKDDEDKKKRDRIYLVDIEGGEIDPLIKSLVPKYLEVYSDRRHEWQTFDPEEKIFEYLLAIVLERELPQSEFFPSLPDDTDTRTDLLRIPSFSQQDEDKRRAEALLAYMWGS